MKTVQAKSNQEESAPEILQVIPTMDVVVFPHMLVPLLILDERIIKGVQAALNKSKLVLLLAAKKSTNGIATIGPEDLYSMGTVASIMRLINIPDGGIKILVQGVSRARVKELMAHDDGLEASMELVPFTYDPDQVSVNAQINNIKSISERIASSGQMLSPDFFAIISRMQDPEKIADFVLSHLNHSVDQGQKLL